VFEFLERSLTKGGNTYAANLVVKKKAIYSRNILNNLMIKDTCSLGQKKENAAFATITSCAKEIENYFP